MNRTHVQANETPPPVTPPARAAFDWPSLLMLATAAAVVAWSMRPLSDDTPAVQEPIAVGKSVPPLRCVDPLTAEPLFRLVPRGWFVWIVLAPEGPDGPQRLDDELRIAEGTWATMADLDRWRRVVLVRDAEQARRLVRSSIAPHLVPMDFGLARPAANDPWNGARRVRHVLVEPTGRILMIEPAESEQAGSLEKIHQDIRRRLRMWEGEFDDLPRFSRFEMPEFPFVPPPSPESGTCRTEGSFARTATEPAS